MQGNKLELGTVLGALARVAERLEPLVEVCRQFLLRSLVNQADETSWRTDGRNGYAWFFGNEHVSYSAIPGQFEKPLLIVMRKPAVGSGLLDVG